MNKNFKNKKLKYAIILSALTIAGIMAGWQMEKEQSVVEYNKENLIRFHVLANSNSAQDQALKYQVRDVIINSMAERFKNAHDVAEAREIVRDSLNDIKDLAEHHIKSQGYDYPVKVTLGDYPFPTKSYNLGGAERNTDTLTLPAGTYEAVRVVIGEGNGANWWCILFPPLCFVDFSKSAVAGVREFEPVSESASESAETNDDKIQDEEEFQQQQEDAAADERAVEAFKLSAPSEAELEGLTGVNNNEHPAGGGIQFRFKCLEIYDQTRNWFTQAFGV